MSQRRLSERRFRLRPARLAVAVLCLAAAVPVVQFGVASAIARARPDLAMSSAPWMSRVLSSRAEQVFGGGQNASRRHEAAELARRALLRDPTNVSALATIGFVMDIDGDREAARSLFASSERLSRRDLRTQLWLVEADVAKNDIPSVLRHYDISMRVFPAARQTLFPILAGAITEPDIRTQLVKTLAAHPNWGDSFLVHAAISGPELESTARLLRASAAARLNVPAQAWAGLISRLVDANKYDEAWSFYAPLHPRLAKLTPRSPRFDQQVEFTTPFDWNLSQDAAVTASLAAGSEGGLAFSAPADSGGTFVQQVQLLSTGRYRLAGGVSYDGGAPATVPYWRIACVGGKELGRIPLDPAAEGGRFAGEFIVPAGCPAQVLALVLDPNNDGSAMSGIVQETLIAPADSR